MVSSELSRGISEITPLSATQGKTWEGNEDCCAAARAIDKDLSTVALSHADNGTGWLKLQLEKIHLINKIIFHYKFYTNWFDPEGPCVKSETEFKGCVDNDNNVDVSVYQGEVRQKSCGTLQLTYGLEQSDQIYSMVCNVEGDTVKLSKDAGALAVYEVVVVAECKYTKWHRDCKL